MIKLNPKKLKKSLSIAIGLIIAFFANEWFKQAIAQPSEIGKWVMIFVSLVIIMIIIYINLDEKGNF
jgi:Na+/glutamate symporter